jgi:hypothetical protein
LTSATVRPLSVKSTTSSLKKTGQRTLTPASSLEAEIPLEPLP